MTTAPAAEASLKQTPLHALHIELGAKMVPFAGYSMPVNYPGGILAEHHHTRRAASLFDVSHMGQIRLLGDGAAAALETQMPMDITGLAPGRQRYGLLTNASGGILDDLMVTHRSGVADSSTGSDLFLIVNAACKDADTRHLIQSIGHRCTVQPLPDRALLALQGPLAVKVLEWLNPEVATLTFMTGMAARLDNIDCYVTRSGYTGEDGFEISVPAEHAEGLARTLLALPDLHPAGLGARDTLRLEAGLCLHGHDIDATTTPVEAGLAWAIQKVRRTGGARAGGYPGAQVIEAQLATGPAVKRVGLVGLERVPVREGAKLFDSHGRPLGHVTSGTLGPSVDQPIALAYLAANHALPNHEVYADVRGRKLPMRVGTLPFHPHRYVRG